MYNLYSDGAYMYLTVHACCLSGSHGSPFPHVMITKEWNANAVAPFPNYQC
jgi:hypothetical protein